MATLTDSERKVVGKWQLQKLYPGGEGDELTKLMRLIDENGANVAMECMPDKTYTMVAFGVAVKGRWSVSGTTATLQTEKIGDLTPDQVRQIATKSGGISGWDMPASQRTEFLHNIVNVAALETSEKLAILQLGVDGKSLYAKAGSNDGTPMSVINVFKPIPE